MKVLNETEETGSSDKNTRKNFRELENFMNFGKVKLKSHFSYFPIIEILCQK